ncbi:MAG: Ig-like domain-containing protein, partial [Bacteroidales bacterium]|nr:Ig-like domain-containing protein [Bacteroidales bacterium]
MKTTTFNLIIKLKTTLSNSINKMKTTVANLSTKQHTHKNKQRCCSFINFFIFNVNNIIQMEKHYTKFLRVFALGAIVLGSLINVAWGQTIRYVKQNGTGSGISWTDASGDLQAMINASSSGDEIWVAAGTYIPEYTIAGYNAATSNYLYTDGDRDNSFVLKSGVKIYGGFAGTGTESNLIERNWKDNPTILSGDRGDQGDISDNCYHVVIVAGSTSTKITGILDGFIIKEGNANGTASVSVNGRTVYRYDGGGIHSQYSSFTFNNLVIHGNQANKGGGIYNSNASPEYANVLIAGNKAIGSTTAGGGMHNANGCVPILRNVTVSGNIAYNCGGIYNYPNVIPSSNPLLKAYNCIIWGNEATASTGYKNTNTIAVNKGAPSYEYTLLDGEDPRGGTNNIDARNGANNPLFINWVEPDANNTPNTSGDYQLKCSSPAVDEGNNAENSLSTDLAGNDRLFQSGTIDIGAYEAQFNYGFALTLTGESLTYVGRTTKFTGSPSGSGLEEKYESLNTSIATVDATGLVTGKAVGETKIRYIYAANTCRDTVETAIRVEVLSRRYVTESGAGTKDGTSWTNASNDLQAMINESATGDQVWVKTGIYIPKYTYNGYNPNYLQNPEQGSERIVA